MLSNKDLGTALKPRSAIIEQPKQQSLFDIKIWGWSLLSVFPWAINARDKRRAPTAINKSSKKRTPPRGIVEKGGVGTSLRFRPYVSKVPWHTGVRAFFSQFFPRYGHYCGPNWSSGKDGGSPLWDKRPIDWLDYCCYCHDIGYDTHDQAELLKADLKFLECLERQHMPTRGNVRVANLYKTMCIAGLKNFLIPYRTNLVTLQTGQPMIDFQWLSNVKWRSWNFQKNLKLDHEC